ncbi:hypothetical protein A6M21_07350 [Desulfotomaculum copahuensis]|uniref:DMSO reductase n=2 Tax=Desulfotomaculum copahuensis TaxID=1838280 RepID=A0A1B7LG88_9FIRM|nr:hypothetical protein A6M21_07350 [Desulfotomaculum copahuensis]
MAVGAFIFYWWSQGGLTAYTAGAAGGSGQAAGGPSAFNGGLIILVIVQALALGVSLLHLGHPLNAYRALIHLKTSWLSREVLLTGFFFAALAACNFWAGFRRRVFAMPLTALLGVIAIMTSGMIYKLPARPAWNSLWPMVSFYLTAWLAGVPLGVLVTAREISPGNGFRQPVALPLAAAREGEGNLPAAVSGSAGRLLLGGIAASVVLNILYLSTLAAGRPEAAATLGNILVSPLFWLRAVLGWLLPGVLLLIRERRDLRGILLLLALVVLGEILGRAVFYGTVVPMGINQGM